MRQDILKRRGYTLSDFWEHHHHQPLSAPIPEVMLPEGYGVRALGDVDELPAPSFLSWKAFHPEEPLDRYDSWEWSLNIQHAPFYRQDLDLIAISPDGEFASFCTIWLTRCGAFEPAGTAPEHQRRGLGKTVIAEGLCRLKDLGAEMVFIGSGSAEAYAFYTSVGFTEWDKSEIWEKDL
ncbi:MAG: GNAT family N-acetyltransferase [Chloroflexi bacterium]|nr:GNAT family N-acetyltransferase [Chloroflexota bacterium]